MDMTKFMKSVNFRNTVDFSTKSHRLSAALISALQTIMQRGKCMVHSQPVKLARLQGKAKKGEENVNGVFKSFRITSKGIKCG